MDLFTCLTFGAGGSQLGVDCNGTCLLHVVSHTPATNTSTFIHSLAGSKRTRVKAAGLMRTRLLHSKWSKLVMGKPKFKG